MTLRLAAILIIVLSTQVACAAKRAGFEPTYAPRESLGVAEMEAPANRELIKTASMEVLVPSVPESIEATTRLVNETNGYVSESITGQDSAARLKLRVPSQKLTELLGKLSKLGEERHRQVSVQDVTEQVADLDAVLANKKALRDRLRALLARASDVKDVLAVESELTRLQTEIDTLEGSLNRLRTDIAYSAVDLQLTPRAAKPPRKILGPLGYLFKGTGWVLKKLWVIRDGE
jgi:hypothetical protein